MSAPNRRAVAMVEEVLDLDVNVLRRSGQLEEGFRGPIVWRWTSGRTSTVQLVAGRSCLAVGWRDDSGKPFAQRLDIRWTACPFGGRRPWFSCASCQHRVCKLYLTGSGWACRRCSRLNYASQMDPDPRLSSRAARLRQRLGIADLWSTDPTVLIERPPRMRRRTFERLVTQLRAEEARYERRHLDRMEKILNPPRRNP